MRLDHILYTVAIIFFIMTGIVYFYQVVLRELWIVATIVFGLFFIGLGYTQRPKSTATVTTTATTQTKPKEEEKTVSETPSGVMLELTEIKGIGVKRAEQLKTLGFKTVEDLAEASAEDLASKLKVSPKITKRWIEEARKLLKKA
ncbi:MAG: helix-hairpin-helix domain-containing protein [Candidatus Bathyarchaeota archaeon]|nr:helix-hairpin-helix domain-containing protein [Candidatus Bathyarchaeota archaeon]MDW8040884.1 helix-hairpin-helix domain-containing protein [Nitrososphaerota archaeon]